MTDKGDNRFDMPVFVPYVVFYTKTQCKVAATECLKNSYAAFLVERLRLNEASIKALSSWLRRVVGL